MGKNKGKYKIHEITREMHEKSRKTKIYKKKMEDEEFHNMTTDVVLFFF